MLGGVFFHTIIGTLMDTFWIGGISNGQRVYEVTSYEYAMWAIPVAAFIGGIVFLFLKTSRKKDSLQTVLVLEKL